MISHTTGGFRQLFARLPEEIQRRAKQAYRRFQKDPRHPGLRLKRVHSTRPIFSVRITRDYRAVGIQGENEMLWFWIGSHADYRKLLGQLTRR
jgi:hypothetical protein